MERIIEMDKIYRHFKGKLYHTICVAQRLMVPEELNKLSKKDIICIADDSEDPNEQLLIFRDKYNKNKIYAAVKEKGKTLKPINEKLVIYKANYVPCKYYARNYDMFASKVNKEKYPECQQEYRFELVEEQLSLGLDIK